MPRDVIQVRGDAETRAQIDDLARAWGGALGPATVSDVIREAVRRAHGALKKNNATRGKPSGQVLSRHD